MKIEVAKLRDRSLTASSARVGWKEYMAGPRNIFQQIHEWGSIIIMWRSGGFGALFWMRNAVAARKSVRHTALTLLRRCGKLEFKQTSYGFSLTS